MAKNDELQVIQRCYDLVQWYLERIAKFPRSQRYGLGARLENGMCEVLAGLLQAKYSAAEQRIEHLHAVNRDLQVIRMFTRLACDMRLMPLRSTEHAARELTEIGKMVGGWLNQQQRKAACSTS